MDHFLLPVLALIIWSLLIGLLLYSRRVPAMMAAKINPEKAKAPDTEWKRALPLPAQYAAHNYTHLMESPTLFYALMFAIYLMNLASPALLAMAWGFVALRAIHSLIQVSGGKVMHRFTVFSISMILLLIMTVITIVGAL